MLQASDLDKKTLEKETHRVSGQALLRQYGSFLELNNEQLSMIEEETKTNRCLSSLYNPIVLTNNIEESLPLSHLLHLDNSVFSNILATLAAACEESIIVLQDSQMKYYNKLLFIRKGIGYEKLENIASLPEFFQDLSNSVKRCQQIIVHIMKQMAALMNKEQKIIFSSADMHFTYPLQYLADLLVHLMILDALLANEGLKNKWSALRRTYRTVQHNYKQFGFPVDKLNSLEKIFVRIEALILSDKIFQTALEQCMDERLKFMNSSALCEEIKSYLWKILLDLETSTQDLNFDSQNWLRLNALFVFYFQLFGNADKKIFKHIVELDKKIGACTLIGDLLWYPEIFLSRHVSKLVQNFDARLVQLMMKQRKTRIMQRAQNVLRDTVLLSQQSCLWMIQLDSVVAEGTSKLKLEHLQYRCRILMQGVNLAKSIEETIKWTLNAHVAEVLPVNRTVVLSIFRLAELLKGILCAFRYHSVLLSQCVEFVTQYLVFQVLTIIKSTKKSLTRDKSYKDANLDVLAALSVAERALHGPCTKRRQLVAQLALSVVSHLPNGALSQVRNKLQQVETICNLHEVYKSFCDLSFLFWHWTLFEVYFKQLFDSRTDINRVAYMFYGVSDCSTLPEQENSHEAISNAENYFQNAFISPLCYAVENNLRIHCHAHLQTHKETPFETQTSDFRSLVYLRPIKLVDHFINVKMDLEHYLSKTFYNLATVVLPDWRTYGEMRRLAYYKYNLETVKDHLPNQTLEQGLDVLEIMRNINVFVSKYLYNLNNQIFVEECSINKHLNTINIRHIANSIRIHGTGIMNTTVNFTYQFLRKKFYIFSQFMYDEQIKSRLIKDLRYFRENKSQLDQMYPFDRADKFNRAIRKLGLTPTGQSYLDSFRLLICHIGNAMGYVRMIRSGGRHCCSDATCFLPDFENIDELKSFCEQENQLSDRTKHAALRLYEDIRTLTENFDEKTEYFKLLVEVFAPTFRNPSNMHLRNFYMIIPPLTINFIEHLLARKDKLNKKNKIGAAFTDDGFAMGLAYILELLEQGIELNSLHWFQSVHHKYQKDRQILKEQFNRLHNDDTKLSQTLMLTEKRIIKYQQEFELLYYNLSSARIFFH